MPRGILLILLLFFPILLSLSADAQSRTRRYAADPKHTPQHRHRQIKPKSNEVEEACSVTRHKDICLKSLAPFSVVAGRSRGTWARAGVSVTITELKNVTKFLVNLNKYGRQIKGRRTRDALLTCVETIQDALDNLHQSLRVMRRLSRGEFEDQMSDVLTWLSAALTDEDTCTDGFEGVKGRAVETVRTKVRRASYFTSNALALVNKLATTGLDLEGN